MFYNPAAKGGFVEFLSPVEINFQHIMYLVLHVLMSLDYADCCIRKARKLFEKNAAPLLHLAGFEVTVVKVNTLFLRRKSSQLFVKLLFNI